VQSRTDTSRRLTASAFGLVLSAALVATMTNGTGRVVALAALVLAALAGQSRRDWREALAVGLAVSAVVAWCSSNAGQVAAPVVTTLCIVLNTSVAAWSRPRTAPATALPSAHGTAGRMLALPAPRAAVQPFSSRRYVAGDAADSPLLRGAEAALAHAHLEPVARERHARVA